MMQDTGEEKWENSQNLAVYGKKKKRMDLLNGKSVYPLRV